MIFYPAPKTIAADNFVLDGRIRRTGITDKASRKGTPWSIKRLLEQQLLDQLEMALSHAQCGGEEDLADACRRFVRLHASPAYAVIKPGPFLRTHWPKIAHGRGALFLEPMSDCVADPDALATCLEALLDGVELEADSALAVEGFELEERGERIPCIAVGLDGPGRFRKKFPIGGMFFLTRQTLGERWTLATRGGRLDEAPNGFLLRLKGIRMAPEPMTAADQLLPLLTPGHSRDLSKALAYLDGTPREAPGDLGALFREAWEEKNPSLAEQGIHAELLIPPDLPPILMRRPRLRVLFQALLAYAEFALTADARVSLRVEYARTPRHFLISAALKQNEGPILSSFILASIQRATSDHGGKVEFAMDGGEALIEIALPDPVGGALDAWMPGWERFSKRSQQVLRMLKSGAALPQPEQFLGGLLEEELERWFWDRLNTPQARNMAYETNPLQDGPPGGHRERRKKVLEQLIRGKPKRELCHPAELGELIWAWRGQERSRAVLGLHTHPQDRLEKFCRALLSRPPDYQEALRFLAELYP